MGSTGFILGGLLQGVGTGMQQDIAAKREAALADLRASREAQNISLKAGYDAKNSEASDARKYEQQKGLLKLGGAIDLAKVEKTGDVEANVVTPAKTKQAVTEIGARGAQDRITDAAKIFAQQQADTVIEKLKQSGDADKMRLAREIAGTEVDQVLTNPEGNIVLIAKGGRIITTNIPGERPKSGADDGGLLGDRGGSVARPPVAASATIPTAAPVAKPKLTIADSDRSRLYADAAMKAQGGDPRFAGKSDSQIKAIIDDGLRNKGYTIR